jgi:hypothetical protein
MTPPQARPVSIERAPAGTAVAAEAGADGPFVINLRSSTTPMALSQPNDPALARFKFFMSRRLEDGRERFRLHMGFFETLAEAEEWLATVREIYPGAWAGEAPGKRLKARAAESAAPASAPAAAAPVSSSPAAEVRTTPAPRKVDSHPPRNQAAAPAVAQPRAPAQTPAPRATPAIPRNIPVLQPAPAPAASTLPAAGRSPRPADAGVRGAAVRESRPSAATPQPAPGRSSPPAAKAAPSSKQKTSHLPLSNVREVLAALDETGATRAMPALHAPKPVLPAAQPAAAMAKPAPAPQPAQSAQSVQSGQSDADRNLSDTQVLKLLEGRRADGSAADVDRGISLLKPDDTATRRALQEAVATNAPVSFAVQLQWSVQSIDISKVPPLAIFSAYTLYTVEGSREGRRWFGLRLGFFSDAISAKQVAHYVRSEFNSVAVVPVSSEERGRASTGTKGTVPASKPATSPLMDRLPDKTAEFKLIDDDTARRSVPAIAAKTAAGAAPATAPASGAHAASAAAATRTAAAGRAARPSGAQPPAKPKGSAAAPAAKRGPRTPAGRVRARDKRSPQTLEETLEILGADQLEIDRGSRETLNDTGVRHITVEVRKNSPFTRLLDRLAERARGR